MKQKISSRQKAESVTAIGGYLILHWLGRISIAVLICTIQISAQQEQQPPPEFPLGVYLDKWDSTNQLMYQYVDELGANTIVQYSNGPNAIQRDLLDKYNLVAVKNDSEQDAVAHYSNGYYTKWEAEDTTKNNLETGIKADYGYETFYDNTYCWTSGDNLNNANSVMLRGPHYRQDKKYKLWYMGSYDLEYILRFNVAATEIDGIVPQPTDPVCKIEVIFTYIQGNETIDSMLKDTTLYVNSFSSEEFESFSLFYEYPPNFDQYNEKMSGLNQYNLLDYDDTYPGTGIQFVVTWYGNRQLYVDWLQVYDVEIGDEIVNQYASVVNDIVNFVDNYSGWNNINYFFNVSEPQTIDQYTPMKMVDDILDGLNQSKGIAEFYPQWNGWRNGDRTIGKLIEMAEPQKVMMEFINYFLEGTTLEWEYEQQRSLLQELAVASPDFWYEPMIAAPFTKNTNEPCWLREPTANELNASIMLGLAHGSKGIVFWKMTHGWYVYEVNCGGDVYYKVLMERTLTGFEPNSLYYYVKENLAPRLKNKLGKTLLSSYYTGNFLQLKYTQQTQPVPVTWDYLTLGLGQPAEDMNWHAGFLKDSLHPDNNYFLLANLWTIAQKSINVKVTEPVQGYENYSFRNVESGYLDTTFVGEITTPLTHPAGEGYLYQVAPVVLYGGRLIYDEPAGEGQTLLDDMIIENGATLTVYGDYIAKANIIVKDGSIVNGENGKIIFEDSKSLIIEGMAVVNGTLSDKLELEFIAEEEAANGITIEEDGSLTITNCIVNDAETGIRALVNSLGVNVQYVDFNECVTSSIAFLGETGEPEVVRQIKYCTITNSPIGISASNLPEVLIQENTITNSDLAINLSNISRAIVFGNNIASNTQSLPGIFAESTGGEIHSNFINGHTNGLHLGNSSPDVGGNHITDCLYHAMLVGSGSVPNMEGRLINIPNSHLWYAISGYNEFLDNGGYEGSGNDNDGSEIYIKENAGVILNGGCNTVLDDREPSGNLVNTLLLMNGDNVMPPIQVEAQYNYWGVTEVTIERFGDLDVNFDDYLSEPCPWPLGGGEDMLVIQTSTGEVVDTLYPTGEATGTLSVLEMLYASAEKSFITGDYASAENYYDQIILIDTLLSEKKEAYTRKYEIGKLLGRGEEYFNDLRNVYLNLAQSTSDPLLQKTLYQLSTLSLVGGEEYLPAIGEFDEIIQQYPGTEEAVYAEIDAITTALLVEGDSTLGKGTLGKYLVKNSDDYLSKLDGILRKHFGNQKEETEEELIPKEYTLYQNYPNPFNPTTTIKYDLPNVDDVSLIIYDILGRKIKELVNTRQQAGRYEVRFDASNLASGIYIYQLITEDYVNAKKMILLK